ncbi:MAG: glycosyltransferase family 4 protein [Nocardioides sp.]
MSHLSLAANQGLMSGGEEMLMRSAEAARDLGLPVTVVAPDEPDDTLTYARRAGFDTVGIPGADRLAYARGLRRWDRGRSGLLWCHGLVPALATAGRPRRIVHLHQLPATRLQRTLYAVARRRAMAVVVPSAVMASRLRGTRVIANWTGDASVSRRLPDAGATTIGFLGRLSQDKGLDVLADSVGLLSSSHSGIRLLVAGDSRFVPASQSTAVDAALARVAAQVDARGWIQRDEFFADVDLAVFPSVWPEPFGLGVAEAMAAGVPCVISDAGALTEVAGPEHPWVAPAGDPAALARVIAEALAADPGPVVDRARARWEAEYSPAAGRARVAALLQSLGLPVAENAP